MNFQFSTKEKKPITKILADRTHSGWSAGTQSDWVEVSYQHFYSSVPTRTDLSVQIFFLNQFLYGFLDFYTDFFLIETIFIGFTH